MLVLSDARVKAVKKLLAAAGVQSPVVVHGWGCQHPQVQVFAVTAPCVLSRLPYFMWVPFVLGRFVVVEMQFPLDFPHFVFMPRV